MFQKEEEPEEKNEELWFFLSQQGDCAQSHLFLVYEEFTEPRSTGIPGIVGLRGQVSHRFPSPCYVHICCLSSLGISSPFSFVGSSSLFSVLQELWCCPTLCPSMPPLLEQRVIWQNGNIRVKLVASRGLFPSFFLLLVPRWDPQPLLTLGTDWLLVITWTFPFILLNKAESV